jgi:hypothetical protein
MPFRGENVYPRNIKVNRTTYVITDTDKSTGYANIAVTWETPFPDANYTLAQGITNLAALDTINAVSSGENHLVTASGFTAQIYVNGSAITGDSIVLNTIAIHDLALLP